MWLVGCARHRSDYPVFSVKIVAEAALLSRSVHNSVRSRAYLCGGADDSVAFCLTHLAC